MIDTTKLIEAGPLGVVVLLVIVFIWYIDRRDKSWQIFTKELRADDNKMVQDLVNEVKQLANELVQLRKDFDEHNTWERVKLDELAPANGASPRKTQPRGK